MTSALAVCPWVRVNSETQFHTYATGKVAVPLVLDSCPRGCHPFMLLRSTGWEPITPEFLLNAGAQLSSHSCAVGNPACGMVLRIIPAQPTQLGKSHAGVHGACFLRSCQVDSQHKRLQTRSLETDRHQNQMEAELPGRAEFPPQCSVFVEGGAGPEPHPAGSTILHTTESESLSISWEIKTFQSSKRRGIIREEQKHGKGVQSEGLGGACL